MARQISPEARLLLRQLPVADQLAIAWMSATRPDYEVERLIRSYANRRGVELYEAATGKSSTAESTQPAPQPQPQAQAQPQAQGQPEQLPPWNATEPAPELGQNWTDVLNRFIASLGEIGDIQRTSAEENLQRVQQLGEAQRAAFQEQARQAAARTNQWLATTGLGATTVAPSLIGEQARQTGLARGLLEEQITREQVGYDVALRDRLSNWLLQLATLTQGAGAQYQSILDQLAREGAQLEQASAIQPAQFAMDWLGAVGEAVQGINVQYPDLGLLNQMGYGYGFGVGTNQYLDWLRSQSWMTPAGIATQAAATTLPWIALAGAF